MSISPTSFSLRAYPAAIVIMIESAGIITLVPKIFSFLEQSLCGYYRIEEPIAFHLSRKFARIN